MTETAQRLFSALITLLFALVVLTSCGSTEVPETRPAESLATEPSSTSPSELAPPLSTATKQVPVTPSTEANASQPQELQEQIDSPAATVVSEEKPSIEGLATLTMNTPVPIVLDPQPVDRITVELLFSGFERPTFLTHAGDQRLFVSEQVGRIWIIEGGQRFGVPFLDISDRVGSGASEQGLLSFAFDPEYGSSGQFYVNYTDRLGDTVISRFETSQDTNIADPTSELVLLVIDQPYGNHNGGQIQFGPDGYLYIGMGDGGSGGDPGNHGQNPGTLLGSLLRVDVAGRDAYAIPPDNPFFASSSTRPETWAFGLRNPWRFSFDRLNGDLYVADVGQNAWEEINHQSGGSPGGQNYGWNRQEGFHCYDSLNCDSQGTTAPIAEYSHLDGGCSVTGGYVYRGSEHPALTGNYFFGDYCTGKIWSLTNLPDGQWLMNEVAQVQASISSFGEDSQGEIYFLDHRQGSIYRIRP